MLKAARHKAILGLGSNAGDRRMQIKRAVRALAPLLAPIRRSPVYESAALLPEHAPGHWDRPFLNMAVCGETRLAPRELLAAVKRIESALGRVPRGHWGPREIDIDILAYGEETVNENDLVIPHPGLLLRDFALVPLADVAPDWRYPAGLQKGKKASDLALALPGHLRRTDIAFCATQLMGIVNVTPDSFSGDGIPSADQALAQVDALLAAGASVIDIGAESTRPAAHPVGVEEECERLAPLLAALGPRLRQASFSVDTRHAATSQNALEAGVGWINDVSGSHDGALLAPVIAHDATLVLMHSLSVPADPARTLPPDCDPVETVFAWGERRIQELESKGLPRERIVFDPGIGFGKTAAQSWELLRRIGRFKALGVPLLVGHSRKSFLTHFGVGKGAASRDGETLSLSGFLAQAGVDYLRVHDVAGHSGLLHMLDALT